MWSLEYGRQTIMDELHHVKDATIDSWCSYFQDLAASISNKVVNFSALKRQIHPMRTQSNELKPRGVYRKPASARPVTDQRPATRITKKRPASSLRVPVKKPASKAVLRAKPLRRRLVVQWDETSTNMTRKKSRLAKSARPKGDQIWVGGAVVEDHPEVFFFKVLEHPQDAFEGKPRGKWELLKAFEELGLEKNDIFVTDAWKGTIAAVQQLKNSQAWCGDDLRHEICNHAQGEIVNQRGFSTNQVENKWSVLKRWIRRRNGGAIPAKRDRKGWKLWLGEFTLRKYFQHLYGYAPSEKRFFVVPFLKALAAHARD